MNKVAPIGKEIHKGGFKAAFDSLPYNIRAEARGEICRRCYWRDGNFRVRINGSRYFSVFEAREIEQFFALHKLNAWTGKQIK
jgi:hypothetical protein